LEFKRHSGVCANETIGQVTQACAFDEVDPHGAHSEKKERRTMAHSRTSFRRIVTRGLALMVMLCIYGFSLIGASALMLGASSAPAQARGGGGGGRGGGFGGGGFRGGGFGGGFRGGGFRGGGFRGGGFRGAGIGLGLGLGLAAPYYYGGYPYGYGGYYGDGCYIIRRQIWTPYGWRIRRVPVCY
jgi:hypothetical protein